MSKEEKLYKGARKIMEVCIDLKKGETVLIVTDPDSSFAISEALFRAVDDLGGEPSILYIKPPQIPGDDPSQLAGEMLPKCDVLITPTSKTLFHCLAVKKALANGRTRLATLSEADEEIMMSGAIEADFLAIKPSVDTVNKKYTDGKFIKYTTPGGTDLTASIDGRAGIANDSICHKAGDANGVPDIEVYIAPVEGTANGTLVIDASSSAIGLIEEPIKITIKDGMATKIEGGKEAHKLRQILENTDDKNCFNLAELAVGMNPKARVRGKIIEDEGALGTCHAALGTNLNFGGNTAAPLHIDMVQWKPTIIIDDEVIFEDGKLVL